MMMVIMIFSLLELNSFQLEPFEFLGASKTGIPSELEQRRHYE